MRVAGHASRAALLGGAALAVVIVLSEVVTWRASRQGVPRAEREAGGGDVVVALGYRTNGRLRANFLQRWRTRIALRSVSASGLILFAGGSQSGRSEAAIMADYATRLGFPADRIRLEEQSRTTWENIANNLATLEGATEIVFASNTFHARRARAMLTAQAPHLENRLRRGKDFAWFEYAPFKAYLVIYEVVRRRTQSP